VGHVTDISFTEPPDFKTGQPVTRKRVPAIAPAEAGQAAPTPRPEHAFVTIRVRHDIQFTDLDRAFLTVTIAGSVALDVVPVTPEPGRSAVPIDENYVLDGEPYVTVGELVNRASDVVEGARLVLPAVTQAVGVFGETAREAKTTVQKVNAAIDENRPLLDQTFKDAAEATQNAKAIAADMKPKLPEILDKVKAAAADAAEALAAVKPKAIASADNIEKTTASVRDVFQRNHPKIDQTLENLRDASARLNLGIENIRRNPWKLLDRNINADPKTQNVYDAALAFSDAARSLSQAASDLKTLSQSGANPQAVEKATQELDKLVANLALIEQQLYTAFRASPAP
jgi:ABC-type transporter Mla subunit MlaD